MHIGPVMRKEFPQPWSLHVNILHPLTGYQRRPDGKVLEVDSVPSPQDFYNKFVKELKPAVFRKMVENVPAMKNWESDQYLKRMWVIQDTALECYRYEKTNTLVPMELTGYQSPDLSRI